LFFFFCIGCPSLIYGFWLCLWYLQTFFYWGLDSWKTPKPSPHAIWKSFKKRQYLFI